MASPCSGFAGLALGMACVGLYGTMSYGVAWQTGEIGMRMALGAPRSAVVWMVLRRVPGLAGMGLAISVPAMLAGVALVLLGAAMAGGDGPARRASRIDPLVALRQE